MEMPGLPVQYRPGQTVTNWHVLTVEDQTHLSSLLFLRQHPHFKGLDINFDLMDSLDVLIYKQQHLPGKYLAIVSYKSLFDDFTIVFVRAQIRLVQITTEMRLTLSAAPLYTALAVRFR